MAVSLFPVLEFANLTNSGLLIDPNQSNKPLSHHGHHSGEPRSHVYHVCDGFDSLAGSLGIVHDHRREVSCTDC